MSAAMLCSLSLWERAGVRVCASPHSRFTLTPTLSREREREREREASP
jgi:hypothetical protein